ncbi:MAG TPA: hypothetical protein DCX34_18370 [Roseovarius sp.]|jgi:hypothetical protein|nr:hypothetical protein [Roseovarius sp.]|tara:strand:+ start:217 stop:459 length:243 start_codon:yes stop_codon:yes gene_type:complete
MAQFGEYRVGVSFNPSSDPDVDKIKALAAALIDAIEAVDDGGNRGAASGEVRRLKALAMTAAEEAAMWGVKAATKPEPGN